VGSSIADVERELILATLDSLGGNKRQTAEVLGVSLKTLYNRINAYRDGEPSDDDED
jgi:DNA-binding NtrC family response regulator